MAESNRGRQGELESTVHVLDQRHRALEARIPAVQRCFPRRPETPAFHSSLLAADGRLEMRKGPQILWEDLVQADLQPYFGKSMVVKLSRRDFRSGGRNLGQEADFVDT